MPESGDTPASQGPALEAVDVVFAYARGRPAVAGVTLRVEAGRAVAILGPNGSGKSTFMRMLCGQLEPASGRVTVGGAGDRARQAARLGVVFQAPSLDPHMTVRENLRDHGAFFGLAPGAVAARLETDLPAAGLDGHADARVKTLSGGMQRRVDLVRALLHEPDVLLLDEPTTGLDPRARAAFLDALDEQRGARGLAVIMTTHLVDEADRFDRVLLMHEGRVVADDAPVRLRAELGAHRLTVPDRAWRPPPDDAEAWSPSSHGLVRRVNGDAPALAAALAEAGVAFSLAPPTLADVFEARTGAALAPEEGETP
jgi:ABC-2 type transport system ATP-binding protein